MGERTVQQKLWRDVWAVIASLKTVLLYYALPALLMSIGMLFLGRSAEEVMEQSSNFYYTLGILLTMVVLHQGSKKKGSSLLEDATLEYRGIDRKKMVLLAIAGFGFSFLFSALITVFPIPEFLMDSYRNSSDGLRDGTDQALALVSTIVLAPIAEEIVFRGYMLNRLLKSMEIKAALMVTTVVFAVSHISLIWVIYAAIMGYLLSWVAIKEDNIAYSIALHIGFNASVLPIWLVRQNETWNQIFFGGNIRILLYGIAAAAMAFWAFRTYREEDTTC